MKISGIVIFLFLIVGNSCEKEKSLLPLPLDESVELKKGNVKLNKEEGIRLIFDSLVEESRCPIGVECVWEGNAAAAFTCYNAQNIKTDFILNTNSSFVTDTLVFGYRIKLLDLKPYPIYNLEINPEDYTAYVEISRE
ncbi:MAG: hypothetical protein H6540_02075 [Bacteroidales bacterium]|nr:hypothetical protein [Bacteroidales bacterium]MCB9014018.1 hypothetical protein [Bacteroidales bacterium]